MLQQAFVQGTQEPGRAPNLVGQRQAVELDALPGIDLGLAVERQVIRVLSDDDMDDQPFGRRAALDQSTRVSKQRLRSPKYEDIYFKGYADGREARAGIVT